MRVLLRGALNLSTGYGSDYVDIAEGLLADGRWDVHLDPENVIPPIPAAVAKALTKPRPPEYDVALWYAPPWKIRPWVLPKCRRVGWSMIEWSPMSDMDFEVQEDEDWTGWRPPDRWKGLDLMLVTCPHNVEAFRAVDETVPIEVLTTGVSAGRWPKVFRGLEPGPIRFGMVGVGGRKDWWSAITAFEWLVEKEGVDATLDIKTFGPGLVPQMTGWKRGLTVHSARWSPARMREFYANTDVLLSTSRGEGVDKPLMEFMATGGPVIATDGSGHQAFVQEPPNWLIRTTPCDGPHGSVQHQADLDSVKSCMLEAATVGRDVLRQRGEVAHRWITEAFGWERVIDTLSRRLESLTFGAR